MPIFFVQFCYHCDLRGMSLDFPTGYKPVHSLFGHLSQVRGGKSYRTLCRLDKRDINSAAVTEVPEEEAASSGEMTAESEPFGQIQQKSKPPWKTIIMHYWIGKDSV